MISLKEKDQDVNSHAQWLGSTAAAGCRTKTGTELESKIKVRI